MIEDDESDAPQTLRDLLTGGADEASALEAPCGEPLTFGSLRALAAATIETLNDHGVGRGDRVAIVLANGPEMAACFIAVASGATAAPLNPNYKADEYEFYLSDLEARILVVGEGGSSPAIGVAEKLGIPVVRLWPSPERGAGHFALVFPDEAEQSEAAECGSAEPDDVALVLHTSGTTSRPKLVPLRQRNICASAVNIAATVRFTDKDRGINIMPLFHIHGLIAGILAPLSTGGCVSCTPGYAADQFFGWMKEVRPTWYTAVPTMHQGILARAAKNKDVIADNPLRFVRSSSSSMPPQVIKGLEEAFGCPLIESYGMTEASHQMASNPLPPGRRRPGSVGVAAGPEVAIANAEGELLEPGQTGEIVIRGANVMAGYDKNDKANAEAFTRDGYFRTGDQGMIDAAGYVTITGRLKEIINRGGEKISPREVDEVMMDHPDVAQCVCFAVPNERLGEEVAAAIVLKDGGSADIAALKAFAAERLAKFKVPEKIVILDEIPKGATGKLQRIGLAEKLGLT